MNGSLVWSSQTGCKRRDTAFEVCGNGAVDYSTDDPLRVPGHCHTLRLCSQGVNLCFGMCSCTGPAAWVCPRPHLQNRSYKSELTLSLKGIVTLGGSGIDRRET